MMHIYQIQQYGSLIDYQRCVNSFSRNMRQSTVLLNQNLRVFSACFCVSHLTIVARRFFCGTRTGTAPLRPRRCRRRRPACVAATRAPRPRAPNRRFREIIFALRLFLCCDVCFYMKRRTLEIGKTGRHFCLFFRIPLSEEREWWFS